MVASLMIGTLLLQQNLPGVRAMASSNQVHGLVWTQGGRLIVVTGKQVFEPQTGRSRPLKSGKQIGAWEEDKQSVHSRLGLQVSPDGVRAIGQGYELDLRTLVSRPLDRPAIWIGNALTEVSLELGKLTLLRKGRKTRVARGWYVIGLSRDGHYAMASKVEPFDGATTYLLGVNLQTGKVKSLKRYPKSSDDHVMLSQVERQPDGSLYVGHKIDVASGIPTPFWLKSSPVPIQLPVAKGVSDWTFLTWLDKNWLVAERHFFFENSRGGFDADALDLWRYRDGKLIRLVKVTQNWPYDDPQETRGRLPVLGAHAIDWVRGNVAYAVNKPGSGLVYVMKIPLSLR
ncbi:MAG: hypothetical protein ABL962_10285 [Fimbriimonadaceae bacterium]